MARPPADDGSEDDEARLLAPRSGGNERCSDADDRRSGSVSSSSEGSLGLEASQRLEPLSGPDDDGFDRPGSSPSTVGTLTRLNGVALVISLQIGSGIFAAPSQVAQFVPTPAAALAVWLLGGLMVWTGAASFIELGLRVPSNGGIQEYLRAAYGDIAGFLFTWVWVAIAKPATNSIIATIFSGYLVRALGMTWSGWIIKLMSLTCIAIVTAINCLGATAGATAANVFLVLKLGALGSIIAAGMTLLVSGTGPGVPASELGWLGSPDHARGSEGEGGFSAVWASVGNFATALFGATYCYGGWETIGFVLGDMKNPEGDLPIVMNGSMATVVIGFVLFNMSLFAALPMDGVRESAAPAAEFARQVFGEWGGILLALVVAVSAMGALNSNIFATAKICVKAGERYYFPRLFANMHCETAREEARYVSGAFPSVPDFLRRPFAGILNRSRRLRWHKSVPFFAHLLNGILSAVYVVVGSFNGLITFIGMTEYSCFLLSVMGVFVLRARDARSRTGIAPGKRHMRTWTANPIIFTLLSGLLILRVIITQPLQGLAIFGVVGIGIFVFYYRFGLDGPARAPEASSLVLN